MTKLNQNFTLWQGEDVVITAAITNEAGTAVSLTGATAVRWSAFAKKSSTLAALAKTLVSGIALVDVAGTDDGVEITMDSNDTDNLSPGMYYHECRVVDSVGNEQVVFVGDLFLKRSRTND